jgi:acyl-coenzyme A synthetase/AMP-(fatty) acid ligase/aryl carrier-like protein
MTPELLGRMRAWLPECRFYNLYGSSEVTADATWHHAGEGDGHVVPIGRPLTNLRAYVLDEHMEMVPLGVEGELYVGGAAVARGYWRRPGLTAERFVADPHAVGERLYRTGDRARLRASGTLEYCGRADHQVKLRGHRIELGEIEAALRQLPGVREAVALLSVEGEPRLLAFVTASEGVTLDVDQVRRQLRTLPEVMIPAAVIQLGELPLNANGKVDRQALRARHEAPRSSATYLAPRTPLEQQMADVWRSVLQVGRVGVHDNFFELGGHSLLGARLCALASERLGTNVTLRMLFEAPTVAALSELLAASNVGRPNDGAAELEFEEGEIL